MSNYENGIETQNRILNACRTLFYQKGYEKTTFKDICAVAQVNQSSIHYHFKAKEAILKIIYEETVEKNGREVQRYAPEDTLPFAKFLIHGNLYLYKMIHDKSYLRLNLDASRILNTTKFEDHIQSMATNFFGHDKNYVVLTEDSFYTLMAVAGFDSSILIYLESHADSCDFEQLTTHCAEIYRRIMNIDNATFQTAIKQVKAISARVDWESLDTTFDM